MDVQKSLAPDLAEPDRKYRDVLAWVWSFSTRPRSATEMAVQRAAKLERMRALLEGLGNPERGYPSVLVAGTKGKGSTVVMIAAGLQASGRRTGRYTSPHLINWRERTCIDARPISTDSVIALEPAVREAVERLPPSVGQPTTFEVGTAFTLLYFARENVEIAVLEVGVGGRYDATNVVEPLVSVITPISFDHMPTLGSTLSEIAAHKAGILRPHRAGIIAPQSPEALAVVEGEASRLHAPLELVGRDWQWRAQPSGATRITSPRHADFAPLETRIALRGEHQRDNATASVAALHVLGHVQPELDPGAEAIAAGLQHVDWPGRLQVLKKQPLVVLDGAHNAASAAALARAVHTEFEYARLHLVLGLTEGKDARGVLQALLPGVSGVIVTRSRHERSAPPSEIAALVREMKSEAPVSLAPDLEVALERALTQAKDDDLVLVTGSLFVVGEALVWWQARCSSR